MIIVKLNGGLGNQMFQYALGRKMSLKNRDVFKLDTSLFTEKNTRHYALGGFNIIENIANKNDIRRVKLPYGPISAISIAFKKKVFRKFNIGFDQSMTEKKRDLYLDGFWQSEKYFDDIASVIREDFRLRSKMSHSAEIVLDSILKESVPVSVHIRRGDYASDSKTNRYHGVLSPEYYKKAFAALSDRLPENDARKIHFFVFSDDVNWVKNNVSFPYPATFISNPSISAHEEMTLMSKCAYHIVANSSFSWWGAWLNSNPKKVVIAPKKWFNTRPSTYKDIVPNSWIKI